MDHYPTALAQCVLVGADVQTWVTISFFIHHGQGYLRVYKGQEHDWNLNSSLRLLIPICRSLHEPRITHTCLQHLVFSGVYLSSQWLEWRCLTAITWHEPVFQRKMLLSTKLQMKYHPLATITLNLMTVYPIKEYVG